MLEVSGNTDILAVTTLSVILLIMSLIMGLKIHWFRARMNMNATTSSGELGSLAGVYRSQPFEVSSSTPLATQPHNNLTASSSSHKSLASPLSAQLSLPLLSANKFKINSKKKLPASSPENLPVRESQPTKHKQDNEDGKKKKTKPTSGNNTLLAPNELHSSTQMTSLTNLSVGQSQPSNQKEKKEDGNKTKSLFSFTKNPLPKPENHNKPSNNSVQNPPVFAATKQQKLSNKKEKNADGNKSKVLSSTSKNPLSKPEKNNQPVDVKRPPDSMGQSMKPKIKVPAPKGILQKAKSPPLPNTDDNAPSLKLIGSSTSLKLTDNSSVTLRQTDDSSPLKLTDGNSSLLKTKTPIPLYILEQEESESES